MENNLKGLLLHATAHHEQSAIQEIMEKFDPLIKKYAKHLQYDCAETDLVIFLIELIYKLDSAKVEAYHEGQLVQFIVKSLRNKAIDLHRKNTAGIEEVYIEGIEKNQTILDLEEVICLQEPLKELKEKQRKVLVWRYLYGYSDTEIAKALKITRQAVNRLKRRALETLRIKGEEMYDDYF